MGFVETYQFTALLIKSLATGQMAVDVAGPVGMVNIVGQYANEAIMYLFMLAGILSINSALSIFCRSPLWTAPVWCFWQSRA